MSGELEPTPLSMFTLNLMCVPEHLTNAWRQSKLSITRLQAMLESKKVKRPFVKEMRDFITVVKDAYLEADINVTVGVRLEWTNLNSRTPTQLWYYVEVSEERADELVCKVLANVARKGPLRTLFKEG